ncbi:MAG: bifunctional phosphopantothenoylcysteine decarboxylase/phosphopantothenate--cysteine ligase CoaBC [Burkholderiales bacterium]|nr:bifunctional phosphopantothenoylcysteine decarboxylase/phosphopantothenate--cysteine ligase CoaBC [Burkholderiales bacterium]
MTELDSRRILLGITGGIAAYKAAELVRLLVKAGFEVQCVMTEAAQHFIGAATLQALSGKPVLMKLWDDAHGDGMDHIRLSREADAILIAPASANFIAKLAHGLADDLLSTLCLARACPLAVAPAMNKQMWDNPATQRNLAQIRHDGVQVFGPASGEQACGELGMGRMLEPESLLIELEALFQPKVLAGKHVMITAGPTYEAIDPVRGITNLSSGKMGYALARAAWEAGATVTLVSGPTALTTPPNVRMISVTTAQEMHDAVMREVKKMDIFIGVAAVADYRVAQIAKQKLKKSEVAPTLTLEPNPDILAKVAALPKAPFCVGFAAETEKLSEHAQTKRAKKAIPLIIANRAQDALGQDESTLILIDSNGSLALPLQPKILSARQVIKHIASLLLGTA